jgi:F0F1-type ATP synthase membrane subunit b/b'
VGKKKELWGRTFNVVKHGLDEEEVSVFVDSLGGPGVDMGQKLEHLESRLSDMTRLQDELHNKLEPLDSLAKLAERTGDDESLGQLDSLVSSLTDRLETLVAKIDASGSVGGLPALAEIGTENERANHLDSLIRLAESKVIDADKLAETLIDEAAEKAEAEGERIVAEASEKATVEEERIMAEAEERAGEIRASAEAEAQDILAAVRRQAEEEASVTKQEAERMLSRSKLMIDGQISDLFDQAQRRLQTIGGTPENTVGPDNEESSAS